MTYNDKNNDDANIANDDDDAKNDGADDANDAGGANPNPDL